MALADRIADLEKILATGATEIRVDGVSTKIDLDAVRRELRRLQQQQNPHRRPRCAAIKLSSSW